MKGQSKQLVIGSRGSVLALWQANFVLQKLAQNGIHSTIKTFKTTGDVVQDRFLHEIGGKGLFIRELEDALLRGECDLAVHSLKDMPVNTPEEFSLCATLPRHAVEDLLVIHPEGALKNLPAKIQSSDQLLPYKNSTLKIATSSLRRESYLRKYLNKVEVIPVRGNVDTRLRKMLESKWDGILLAHASLERLSLLKDYQTAVLSPDVMIPCAGQGALAIEMKKDHPLLSEVKKLNCEKTYREISVERCILRKLGGDCTMPFGSLAQLKEGKLKTATIVLAKNGESAFSEITFTQENEKDIAEKVFQDLEKNGLEKIFNQLGLKFPS